ncbi:hypothetical protein N0V87_006911 [Didymella glomerata]|uniref:Uncharacterized protein n=1 Tax=Didymella glomerata TaxID=749621 RepID=A0A9W9BY37_9PLEO|nr:hypothetical protein N0V87_006911 [Didymella glomerata]
MVNESDLLRYANSKWAFVLGTCCVQWLVGIFEALGGLVTTAACQIMYGKIYWNPPDLVMVMDNGDGSSASRAGAFFLALASTFAILFQNVCGNADAGGIDLAGIFPRYIDIR